VRRAPIGQADRYAVAGPLLIQPQDIDPDPEANREFKSIVEGVLASMMHVGKRAR